MEAIGSAFNRGVQGIQRGLEGLERDADQIAKSRRTGQMTRPMVNLIADRARVEASVKVVQTADAMSKTIGSLLDVTV